MNFNYLIKIFIAIVNFFLYLFPLIIMTSHIIFHINTNMAQYINYLSKAYTVLKHPIVEYFLLTLYIILMVMQIVEIYIIKCKSDDIIKKWIRSISVCLLFILFFQY